jgi:hypothetical protein
MIHTTRSDGFVSPDTRLAAFKNVFDWAVETDHDTSLDQSKWTNMINEANGNNTNNNFTYFFGAEWTKSGGLQHIGYALINPPATLITASDPALDTVQELATWLILNNGTAQYNHPARLIGSGGTNFSDPTQYNETVIPLAAIIGQNGGSYTWQFNYYYNCSTNSGCTSYINPKMTNLQDENGTGWVRYALDHGLHLGFAAETDYHGDVPYEPQAMIGLANPINWTREGILDTLRKRHTWATENKTIMQLNVSNGTNIFTMGDIINYSSHNSNITLNYSISASIGENISSVSLFYKGIIVNVTPFSNQQNITGSFIQNLTNNTEEYLFIEATQTNGQKAWTSPVWVTLHS